MEQTAQSIRGRLEIEKEGDYIRHLIMAEYNSRVQFQAVMSEAMSVLSLVSLCHDLGRPSVGRKSVAIDFL